MLIQIGEGRPSLVRSVHSEGMLASLRIFSKQKTKMIFRLSKLLHLATYASYVVFF